ncbi:carotenoid 1,2-hydratase, partial [Phenylobacterium sp.]|uniref:carotenoid 1,2-hydratase n=1 Tax=Phenylobacterium sp. TaxID=1871053 RepID=UPI0027336DE1
LSDPSVGRLLHDQRVAREGFGLARASARDTDIDQDDWSLRRRPEGRFLARIDTNEYAFDLVFEPTQPVLLQGLEGYSRKGPAPRQASRYYTLPQLAVSGTVRRGRRDMRVGGRAWLDREWSSTLLDPKAVGWDWTGINLDDGGALMAFQVRNAAGGAVWAGATLRNADGSVRRFAPSEVKFTSLRTWRSPRTAAAYPVERVVTLRQPGFARSFRLTPLFDDQELDSRVAAGPVYWEGAVTTAGGRGYLELTGYVAPLRL